MVKRWAAGFCGKKQADLDEKGPVSQKLQPALREVSLTILKLPTISILEEQGGQKILRFQLSPQQNLKGKSRKKFDHIFWVDGLEF